MALISKIRKHSWLLILMLALGLGGFVAMDMVGAASKASGNQFTIGQGPDPPVPIHPVCGGSVRNIMLNVSCIQMQPVTYTVNATIYGTIWSKSNS